jgi:hypothetical protein
MNPDSYKVPTGKEWKEQAQPASSPHLVTMAEGVWTS